MARVLRGLGALSFSAAITTLGQLSIVPIALRFWGEQRYGEWILLSGLVSLLRLTDLGLQTFVVNRMNEAYTHGREDELRRVLNSALRVQWPVVGIVLVVLVGAAAVLPLGSLLGLHTIEGAELSVLVVILGFEFLMGGPFGVIGGVYRAIGRLPRSAMLSAVQQLALLAATLVLIAVHSNFIALAVTRVAVGLALAAWFIRDLWRWFPWLRPWPVGGSWRLGIQMLGPGLFFLLIPLADYLSTQVSLAIVQHSLDGGEVSRLATHRTTVNVAQMASGIFMSACWPELTALRAQGRTRELLGVHAALARINLWIVGSIGFGMLPFVAWIYPSWTAGRLQFDVWTFVPLALRLLVWAVWSTSLTMLLATNRHRRVAIALLVAAAVNGGLSIILVPLIGIRGAAIGALAADLLVSAWFIPKLLMQDLGGGVWAFFRSVGGCAVITLVLPVGLAAALWLIVPNELVHYAVVVPLTTCLALALMWTQLGTYERELLLTIVRRVTVKARRFGETPQA